MISMAVHRNVLHLKGFCMTPTERLLVYPFMANGNVASWLRDEEFEAVVGDFGLAKLMDCNDTHVTTPVRGTIGHIAPEYLEAGQCSEKTDVFGYGVKRLLREKKLETLVHVDLKGNYIDVEVEQLIQLALLCTQRMPLERPKMCCQDA
ncbi:hypothetical protein L1987_19925 [Smallanthus sonchifolius]|uniref:Uncharacterized protein n=1 Tax=Smallanthus sonchifolius TaxID=185202 RepID=A0ACB9IRM8_9ASTR|nr:hypothetical protein L1987_19925 [Smallanthus sonchifolius]